ncbi:MAG: hypothetical protein CMO80_11360 [Verrucomicrobiales bacterium]|nr:hypothetical protein [Verrucomicrobiales bacterium]|tara:strand:- start:5685 stop:6146 length:462 start_codon:yes stop_codon:yes gene_type:complete
MNFPTPAHEKLAALVGDWTGKVTVAPNPQLPDGATAESRISSRFKLNQWFVVSDYEQLRGGERYSAHGRHGWDPRKEKFTFYWFDSDGWDPGAPAIGEWNGDTLQLIEDTSMGPTRYTYTFTGNDTYTLTLENSTDGEVWNLLFTEKFQRVSD